MQLTASAAVHGITLGYGDDIGLSVEYDDLAEVPVVLEEHFRAGDSMALLIDDGPNLRNTSGAEQNHYTLSELSVGSSYMLSIVKKPMPQMANGKWQMACWCD